uniref:Deacetylase sirtuin-type domain-containing protein n=1 Tax=Guillardia theta TaxID=55529 RepID=A0A7S4PKJ3_GUITH|mmetsp:Transcript_5415/g.19045  ORF Transcript_5415/g.19045 Transcript_5415/m.19045 type:complete len:404 (+) Transcript_5415:248-1459(+)
MPDLQQRIDQKKRRPPLNRKKEDLRLRLRAIKLSDPDPVMKTLEDAFVRAAELLLSADYVLIAAGAGFSADSGLPVYKDIADVDAYKKMDVTYADLCVPDWLLKDPEIFYGFWGSCYNDYLGTTPHKGYEIVKEWIDCGFKGREGGSGPGVGWGGSSTTQQNADILQPCKPSLRGLPYTARPTSAVVPASRDQYSFKNRPKSTSMIRKKLEMTKLKEPDFFVYTSNVDTAFQRAGVDPALIYEIHGDVMKWQCRIPCCQKVWSLPDDYRFQVDKDTRRTQRFRNAEGQKGEEEGKDLIYRHGKVLEIEEPSNRKMDFRGLTPYTQNQSLNRLVRFGDEASNRKCFDEELRCQVCDGLARPNVLMFDDDRWIETDESNYKTWVKRAVANMKLGKKVVILEVRPN